MIDVISAISGIAQRRKGYHKAAVRLRNGAFAIAYQRAWWELHCDGLAEDKTAKKRARARANAILTELADYLKALQKARKGSGQKTSDLHKGRAAALPSELGGVAAIALPQLELALAFERQVRAFNKELERLAQQLPCWPWVESVRGVGALGLALIVAEAGDLAAYDTPAKLWKRFGLAVFEGCTQRRTTDRDLALVMGFNPVRRALAYNLSESLLKQNREGYRVIYDLAKAAAVERGWTKLHAHRHGLRVMVKRFLRDLWREWVRAGHEDDDDLHEWRAAPGPLPTEVA